MGTNVWSVDYSFPGYGQIPDKAAEGKENCLGSLFAGQYILGGEDREHGWWEWARM